ncbi:MAG TPA: hypothetical protein DCP64_12675, partial [Sarcina sp.]|nr:hypothetical protein [Sarcina sp.]
ASLQMTYHIDWKVLDDETYGPLDWVDIGLPNSHHSGITALGDNISNIEDNGSSAAVYLDRSYYKDEVASFEFSFVQDNMYQIGRYVEGETVFAYTPAWFDEIEVKDLTIRWNADKAGAWQPDCLQDDGYLVFSSALSPGEHYSITVAYPNDAFAFSSDRQAGSDDTESEWSSTDDDYDYNYESSTGGDDLVSIIGGLIVLFVFFVMPLMMVVRFFRWIAGGAGFGSSSSDGVSYQKKITRTKIEYYETCPGCGAAHEEGRDDCPYCGRSMIKSREVVEEKDLDKPENYSRTGTYRYGNSPNTFIHVNVINVPVVRPSGRRSTGGS